MLYFLFAVALLVAFAFAVGLAWGAANEAAYWRHKGDWDEHGRTAVCSGGRFYYVVPEAEYCELSRLRYTSRPAAPEGD